MKLEDQVCSIEFAKKLKELGVKQDSYFKYELRESGYIEIFHSQPTSIAHKYYSAFTVAELGDMLPDSFNGYELKFSKTTDNYCFYYKKYIQYDGNVILCLTEEKKEADARAKMIIYLIENKLIDLILI